MQSREGDISLHLSPFRPTVLRESGAATPGILSDYEKTSAPRRNCVRKIVSHRLNVASLTFSRWIAVRCVIVYEWEENRRGVGKTVQPEPQVTNFSISFKIFLWMRLSNNKVKKIEAVPCIVRYVLYNICEINFAKVTRKQTRTIFDITVFI